MPRSEPHRTGHAWRGFTLIEVVMVIAVTGVLFAVVGRFIVQPVQGYMAAVARAGLVDTADLSLRRIGRDLAIALPNSVRVTASGLGMELIPTTGAARYATESGDRLDFGTVDNSFDIVGPPLNVTASQQLVFYNLGPNVTGSNAYADNSSAAAQAQSNRRTAANAAGSASTIKLSSLAGLPVGDYAPPYRVTAVSSPVTYRCDLAAGTLTRYQGYGFLANQPDPPVGGSNAVLATGVSACRFSVEGTLVAARAALVNLQLTLSGSTSTHTESVSLQHAVYVSNQP